MSKLYLLILMCLTFFSACKEASSVEIKNDTSTSIEEDKKALRYLKEVEWPKAYASHDTILLDRILDDSFEMIDQVGNRTAKSDEIVWIRNNASSHDSFRYDIKRLDIYPNGSAIVSGTGHMINNGAETIYQSSNVLIKKEGLWKAISSHVSGVKTLDE